MSKMKLIVMIFLSLGIASSAFSQKNRTLKNGFSLNLVTGVPSESFGVEKASDIDSEYALNTLWGLQIGNRWYISPTETWGIGIMANWFDIAYSAKAGSTDDVDWARGVFDISFIELGPVGTYALNEDIALDAYYNLHPTLFLSALVNSSIDLDEDVTFAYGGFGFAHAIGAAFRWRALNLGVEYEFGGIESVGVYTGPGEIDLDDQNNKTNSLRFMIGVKF